MVAAGKKLAAGKRQVVRKAGRGAKGPRKGSLGGFIVDDDEEESTDVESSSNESESSEEDSGESEEVCTPPEDFTAMQHLQWAALGSKYDSTCMQPSWALHERVGQYCSE